jgi:hypothetical protein
MPEIIDPTVVDVSRIVTETRAGNPIENCQPSLITELDKKDAEDRQKRWGQAKQRGEDIVPHYNCHGLTFASRRTAVNDSLEVRKVISEDKYLKVDEKRVMPGDVIVYVSAADGDLEHSGVVVAVGEPPFNIPQVVSKWGKGFEVVHAANYCPYNYGGAEYYRIVK